MSLHGSWPGSEDDEGGRSSVLQELQEHAGGVVALGRSGGQLVGGLLAGFKSRPCGRLQNRDLVLILDRLNSLDLIVDGNQICARQPLLQNLGGRKWQAPGIDADRSATEPAILEDASQGGRRLFCKLHVVEDI